MSGERISCQKNPDERQAENYGQKKAKASDPDHGNYG
jgi:hypothetical protein